MSFDVRRLLAALVGLTILVAACSSDDGTDSATSVTSELGVTITFSDSDGDS